MRLLIIFLVCMPALLWSQRYQLTAPRIVVDSVFFRQKADVQLEFDLDGATVFYTTDGKLPAKDAPVYKKPFTVDSSTVVRAKSEHPDFLPSRFVEKQLFQVSAVPDSIHLLTMPDTTYPGKLGSSLFDLQKGSRDLSDGRWLGFKGDTAVVEVQFKQVVAHKLVLVSSLFDPGAWIFSPAGIEVYGKSGDKDWTPIGRWNARTGTPWKDQPAKYDDYQRVVLRRVKVDRLRIVVVPYGPLPEGHPGAGKPAWLFLDEIVFQ